MLIVLDSLFQKSSFPSLAGGAMLCFTLPNLLCSVYSAHYLEGADHWLVMNYVYLELPSSPYVICNS